MVTEESIQEKYSQLGTIDLLEIIAHNQDYTELAVSVALKELRYRRVPENEIADYKSVFDSLDNKPWIKNCLFDLSIFQKIIFYFFCFSWVPRFRGYFTKDFIPNGYILKQHQSNYYSVTGFLFFVLSIILDHNSYLPFLGVWISGFFTIFLFDVLYNRERQIKNLKKIVETGELPFRYRF